MTNLIKMARATIKRADFSTAENAVAEAEKLDAKAASEVRAELKVAESKSQGRKEPAIRN